MTDRCEPPAELRGKSEDDKFPRWIGDSLWVSAYNCVISVYSQSECGRKGDYYECGNLKTKTTLRISDEDRAIILAAFAHPLPSPEALAALVDAARAIMQHAGIADQHPDDKDGEDHMREAALTAALIPFTAKDAPDDR